jgi:hypothetical protein
MKEFIRLSSKLLERLGAEEMIECLCAEDSLEL